MNKEIKCICKYDRLRRLIKKLHSNSKIVDLMERIHYAAIKIYTIRLQRKAESTGRSACKITFSQKDITDIFALVRFYFERIKYRKLDFSETNELTLGFRYKTEKDALQYFKEHLSEKSFKDSLGTTVLVPWKSHRFMYKDEEKEQHTVASEFYQEYRGKRQSLIPFTIENSQVIFERYCNLKKNMERMYLYQIIEFGSDGKKQNPYFFAVITHGKRKDGFIFTTAFRITNDNSLLKRIQDYTPVTD